jgi:hypothetical protein
MEIGEWHKRGIADPDCMYSRSGIAFFATAMECGASIAKHNTVWATKNRGEMAGNRIWRSKRARHKTIARMLTWTALLLLAGGGFLIVRQFAFPGHAHAPAVRTVATAPSHAQGLKVLASEPADATAPTGLYSVIPGGVHSEKQLAEVLAHDPIVAKHYAKFDLQKLRFVRLNHGREAYVSYRLGNMIFWTNHKIALFAGETLLTDGVHYARARCGNRVSEVPKQPTSSFEPSDLALAQPILHLLPGSFKFPPIGAGIHMLPTGVGVATGLGGGPVFPVVFIPPGGGGSGGTPVYPPPGDEPLPTPEPGTLLLFATGLAAVSLKYFLDPWRN